MSAEPIPSGIPNEPAEVARFRKNYEEALVGARISAEHTATEGWRNLYGEHRDAIAKARKEISDRFNGMVEAMRLRHLTEGEEKALADMRKELIELREQDESFQRQTVEPVIRPMQDCASVIEEARSTARSAESEFALGKRGLIEVMESVIETMPRVKFMVASGLLVVSDE